MTRGMRRSPPYTERLRFFPENMLPPGYVCGPLSYQGINHLFELMQTTSASFRFFSFLLGLTLLIGLLVPQPHTTARAAEAPTYAIDLAELRGMPGAEAVLAAAPEGIRIKIVIVIKIGKKGIAEITDMQLSGTDLGSSRILAEAEVRGKRLYLKPLKGGSDDIKFLTVRDQFMVPLPVSRKLGWNDTMLLKPSRVEMQPNSLLQFEIQM